MNRFKKTSLNIKTIVLSFLLLLFILYLIKLFFSRSTNNTYKESMNNLNEIVDKKIVMDKYSNFCKMYQGNSNQLETACNKLTTENCNKVSCCVHINGKKCVAGSQNGSTYKSDKNGDKINVDYYYYKNKCTGKCPK
jgi:hypothetical protein